MDRTKIVLLVEKEAFLHWRIARHSPEPLMAISGHCLFRNGTPGVSEQIVSVERRLVRTNSRCRQEPNQRSTGAS
jgi:hypothetical protein